MKEKRPAHRPKRQAVDVKRQVYQPEVKACPYCGGALKSTHNLHVDKIIQTLTGRVNVRAYGYRCSNPTCPHPEARYHAAKELLRLSLPFGTYGLDVLAFIGWQREREHRQLVEIQALLNEQGIAISERHVGRLYRQYLALLAGLTASIVATLQETEMKYGGLIWALDGLQPDQDGTQLYVLYEVLSHTPVAAAWLDKRDAVHLQAWLAPYGCLGLRVLATLSDGEEAEVKALKATWPGVAHQLCQVHFLGDVAEPIRDGDQRLREALAARLSPLPPVPDHPTAAKDPPPARSLEVVMPTLEVGVNATTAEEQEEGEPPDAPPDQAAGLGLPADEGASEPEAQGEAQRRMQELELQFRRAFQDVLHRPSRKPLTFGGLAGYEQLQSLVCTLQFQLSRGGVSYLHTLLEKGQRALDETAELAHDVHQARNYLQQIAHLLAIAMETEAVRSQTGQPQALPFEGQTNQGEQVKHQLQAKLDAFDQQPCLGPVTRAFLGATRRSLRKREADLFWCYDIPGLPPNNMDLEAVYNRLRRDQRRISGRKTTAELRRTAHCQVLLRAPTFTALWEQLRSVPLAAYHMARQRLDAAEEQQRWRYRLHRWPIKTATAMVREYLTLRHQVQVVMPTGP
jgi:hypothetical protein